MINIQQRIEENDFKSKMLVQVHDELVFEVHNNELKEMKEMIQNEMENAYDIKIPLKVDIGTGLNWFEAH